LLRKFWKLAAKSGEFVLNCANFRLEPPKSEELVLKSEEQSAKCEELQLVSSLLTK